MCNRNVTLKMAVLRAETCRWKYHNGDASEQLSAFDWFLIQFVMINACYVERVKVVYVCHDVTDDLTDDK
jgi:hypothetical protein